MTKIFKGVVKYDFTFLTLVEMLLFEHKQQYQSYNAQSSKQRKIFGYKQMAGRDYTTFL